MTHLLCIIEFLSTLKFCFIKFKAPSPIHNLTTEGIYILTLYLLLCTTCIFQARTSCMWPDEKLTKLKFPYIEVLWTIKRTDLWQWSKGQMYADIKCPYHYRMATWHKQHIATKCFWQFWVVWLLWNLTGTSAVSCRGACQISQQSYISVSIIWRTYQVFHSSDTQLNVPSGDLLWSICLPICFHIITQSYPGLIMFIIGQRTKRPQTNIHL